MADANVTAANLRLLPSEQLLQNLESAVTSVSQKPIGGSLTTVVQQALQSEDVEQLDWVLSQKEAVLVT